MWFPSCTVPSLCRSLIAPIEQGQCQCQPLLPRGFAPGRQSRRYAQLTALTTCEICQVRHLLSHSSQPCSVRRGFPIPDPSWLLGTTSSWEQGQLLQPAAPDVRRTPWIRRERADLEHGKPPESSRTGAARAILVNRAGVKGRASMCTQRRPALCPLLFAETSSLCWGELQSPYTVLTAFGPARTKTPQKAAQGTSSVHQGHFTRP